MDCIFCKIASNQIPSEKIYEDDYTLAFRDLSPVSPEHILVIPKQHTDNIYECESDVLIYMHNALKKVVDKLGVKDDGFRVVFNTNKNGGQTVGHLHMHVLAGRLLQWPPG